MRSKNDHLGNNIINKCKEVISLQVGGWGGNRAWDRECGEASGDWQASSGWQISSSLLCNNIKIYTCSVGLWKKGDMRIVKRI